MLGMVGKGKIRRTTKTRKTRIKRYVKGRMLNRKGRKSKRERERDRGRKGDGSSCDRVYLRTPNS